MIHLPRARMLTLPCFALIAALLAVVTSGIPVKTAHSAGSSMPSADAVWGSKPVLGYFVLNPDRAGHIKQELRLTAAQFNTIRAIAIAESEHLHTLFQTSERVIQDPRLSFAAKRDQIRRFGYNAHMLAALRHSDAQLRTALNPQLYATFVNWTEQQWQRERAEHGMAKSASANTGRTYTVFATQYKAHGNYEIAIPDKCVKFANLGWSLSGCPAGAYSKGRIIRSESHARGTP